MKLTTFQPIFSQKSEFCEKTDPNPVSTYVPNQAITISELIARFERGERVGVHQNFTPMDNMTRDYVYEESFDDAAPDDVHDVVDVENYKREHDVHKKQYEKAKKKAKESQPAPSIEAPQDPEPSPDA